MLPQQGRRPVLNTLRWCLQAITTLHNTELHGHSIIVRLERSGERPAQGNGNGGGAQKQGGSGSIANSGRPQNSTGLQARATN